jgi:bacterioferritin-associated ferredoxin
MKTVIIFIMIVCLCEGISESEIVHRIRGGATTSRALARSTGVGTRCGACACDVKRLVRRERATAGDPLPVAAK